MPRSCETYTGRACRKCNGTERYKAGYKCVACERARSLAKWRIAQREADEIRMNEEYEAFMVGVEGADVKDV